MSSLRAFDRYQVQAFLIWLAVPLGEKGPGNKPLPLGMWEEEKGKEGGEIIGRKC
jgi:hypothetical protein